MVQAAQMRDELDRLAIIDRVTEGLSVDGELLREKAIRTISDEATIDDVRDALIKRSLEMMDEANPEWTYVASRIYLEQLYNAASINRGYDADFKYGDFYAFLKHFTESCVYTFSVLYHYYYLVIYHYFSELTIY